MLKAFTSPLTPFLLDDLSTQKGKTKPTSVLTAALRDDAGESHPLLVAEHQFTDTVATGNENHRQNSDKPKRQKGTRSDKVPKRAPPPSREAIDGRSDFVVVGGLLVPDAARNAIVPIVAMKTPEQLEGGFSMPQEIKHAMHDLADKTLLIENEVTDEAASKAAESVIHFLERLVNSVKDVVDTVTTKTQKAATSIKSLKNVFAHLEDDEQGQIVTVCMLSNHDFAFDMNESQILHTKNKGLHARPNGETCSLHNKDTF